MVEQEWTVFRFGDDDNFPIPELETTNFGDFEAEWDTVSSFFFFHF